MKNVKESIYIYHTNDIHSHFENWSRISYFIDEARKRHEEAGESMLVVDIGDFADRMHPITEATNGKGNVRFLNDLQYDAVTIGNNEGISLSHEMLDTLYEEANFKVIVANVFHKNGEMLSWAVPFHIITLHNGLKIGLIGVTYPYQQFYELLHWQVTDPFEEVKKYMEQLQTQVDIIIVLSHLGLKNDQQLAMQNIDIILGSHTHHVLPEGEWCNDTLLCGAGKYGEYIGVVQIDIENETIIKTAKLIDVRTLEKCEEIETRIQEETKKSEEILSEPLFILQEDLRVDWFGDSTFSTLFVEGIKEWCDADIGMMNAGILLNSLQKGIVTKKDIHQTCPHPINLCRLQLTGAELIEVIRQANTTERKKLKLTGFGFRGKIMGEMIYSGLDFDKVIENKEERIENIKVNGCSVSEQQIYSIGTLDMFTFGYLYPEMATCPYKQYYLPEMLRDVLTWKLLKGNIIEISHIH